MERDEQVDRIEIVREISHILDDICRPCRADETKWSGKGARRNELRHEFCIRECAIGKKLKKLGKKLDKVRKDEQPDETKPSGAR